MSTIQNIPASMQTDEGEKIIRIYDIRETLIRSVAPNPEDMGLYYYFDGNDLVISMVSDATNKAVRSIVSERLRQDAQWGEQNHDPFTYLTILMEEVGETSQAAIQTRFGGKHGGLDKLRDEAVQAAAVAMAIVECLDRGKWSWPDGGVSHVT